MFGMRSSLVAGARPSRLVLMCALAVMASAAPAQQGNGVGSQFELTFWQSVSASEDRSQLEAYLAQYPNGTFAALARAKIAVVDKRDALARGVAMPAPVPAPVPVAPLASAATMAAAVPIAAAPAPTVAPLAAAPVATPAAMTVAAGNEPTLSDQLRALGQSQGLAPTASAVSPASGPMALAGAPVAANALPARPQLASLSDVALPDHFCSAVERNGYYDSVFTPAKDVAEQNNRTAIAHMQQLRQMYDALAQSQVQNAPTMNVIAGEAKDYEAVAADAYSKSAAYEGLFNRLMAVPIRKCS